MTPASPAISRIQRTAQALKPAGVFLVVISLVVLGGGLGWALGNNPILSCMMLGACVIHMSGRPRWRELLVTLVLAVVFRVAYISWSDGFIDYFASSVINWGGFLGLASLVVMFVQALRCQDEQRPKKWTIFLTASALPYTWIVVAMCLGSLALRPATNDNLLCAFDASLGFLPSFALGKIVVGYQLYYDLTQVVYNALPLGAAFVLASQIRSPRGPVRIIPLYISMMILGSCLYWIFPGAGPAYAYSTQFPWNPPRMQEILALPIIPFVSPRNAMPSLHFGAMLVLLWNSRSWRWPGRLLALCFSLGVAFATVALGEHYLIDLVVAFPFVAGLQAVWTTAVPLASPRRYLPIAWGVAVVTLWLVMLRWNVAAFLPSMGLGWSSILTTVAGSVALEWRLSKAAARASAASPETGLGTLAPDSLREVA